MSTSTSWIINNLINNLPWEILTIIFATVLLLYKSFKISRFLLKRNRFSRGNGFGLHFADRFIDIYYSSKFSPITYGVINNAISSSKDYWVVAKAMDDKLMELNLAEKNENGTMKVIKSLQNKIIIFLIKLYLIYIFGDKKEYYRNLNEEYKKGLL